MKAWVRIILAVLYAAAGVLHIVTPAPFLSIVPAWLPFPGPVIMLTGIAEICGAAGLAQPFSPALRRMAGLGLAVYAICVFPANINHFAIDMARPDNGLGLGYHIPRMLLQPVLVWLALWAGGVTGWPMRSTAGSRKA